MTVPVRVAQVAPLYESVPPPLYGGTERVVSWLTEELVERGHEVTLFAGGDSHTAARLVAPEKRPDLAIEVAKRVGMSLRMAAKVDPSDRDYFEGGLPRPRVGILRADAQRPVADSRPCPP